MGNVQNMIWKMPDEFYLKYKDVFDNPKWYD